jgi:hypothetical protein
VLQKKPTIAATSGAAVCTINFPVVDNLLQHGRTTSLTAGELARTKPSPPVSPLSPEKTMCNTSTFATLFVCPECKNQGEQKLFRFCLNFHVFD